MDMKTNTDNVRIVGNDAQRRVDSRVSYRIDIYYPIINNVSIYKGYDLKTPIMTAVNISESGICFDSKIAIKVGDFISFLLQVGDNPSFWCLCEAKWVEPKENTYYVGCRFYLLSDQYLHIIREYVKNALK